MGSDREEIESACDTAIGLPGHTEHQALHAMRVILERPLTVDERNERRRGDAIERRDS